MYRFIKIFILFTLVSIKCFSTIVYTDTTNIIPIGNQVSVLAANKELTINDAVKSLNKFIPLNERISNLGINAHSVWLRFSISNQSKFNNLLLEVAYPILDEVELFIPTSPGKYKAILSGEIVSFNKRAFEHPNPIFNLDLPPGKTQTYYLRIKSSEQIILPLTVTRPLLLWKELNEKSLFVGIYAGIIIIMSIYNLFLFFSTNDKSYLYYVIYVFFIGLTQAGIEGYNYLYLWPASPSFELKSVQSFACIGSIAALYFAYTFLNVKKLAPVFGRILIVGIGVFIIALCLPFANLPQLGFRIMQLNTTIFSVFVLYMSFYIMIKGFQPAKFFFVAWSIFIIGSLIFLLKDYNILPYNNFTQYSVEICSSLEIALLSFALANRINILKKEKESSQLAALKLANEKEQIVNEQNIRLEKEVKVRTQELSHKNNVLNKTYEDLKQAQTQLVATEKMSSLGQLTAGIAHEINNPINFVAANISPLKRDIHQLFDTISKIEAIGLQDKPAEDKIKEIAEYKEEQDLDYVQMEITHLLKGIHEGASRTADIVKGLRTFSRLDEDDLKSASINDGLSSTLTISSNLLKGIEVDTLYGDIPMVTCYPGKLNQVFLNIITNAIFAIRKKFGDKSGGMLCVKTYAEGDFVFVSIKDDGTGMDDATKAKLFEPFFTTKKVGEGTGLGMSIAFTIIEQHYADLTVHSTPGEGTEFILRLPVQPPRTAGKS